ncbi:MAG: DUF4911 domain-containing protein [Candidatus Sumerlaeaceae bacterium]|nr:DUF4911 domain-containing protein [Candidatus Sumerlaeaceae bacterium]
MRRWDDYEEDAEVVYEARVPPSEIHYVCSITEAYEGLAVVRTKDEKLGIVQFWVPIGVRGDFEEFLARLSSEIELRVSAPRPHEPHDFDFFANQISNKENEP